MPSLGIFARALTLHRLTRSKAVRWTLIALLAPVLLLGTFDGASLVAHSHGGRGTHFHATASRQAAMVLAQEHQLAHSSGAGHCDDAGTGNAASHEHEERTNTCEVTPAHLIASECSHDVLLTVPDHEQLRPRNADLWDVLKIGVGMEYVLALWKCEATVLLGAASPHFHDSAGPQHLCSLHACLRLLRTSHALLI